MKILHVDETFHPAYGYQTTPLAKFQQKQGNEVYILAPTKDYINRMYHAFGDYGEHLVEQDAFYEKTTGVKIIRIPGKGFFMNRLVYGKELFKAVDQIKPDVILVHCIETLTGMRFVLKNVKYPLVFDSHMLKMASNNKFANLYEIAFQRLLVPIIKKRQYDVIRTQDDNYVNVHLGIPEEQTPFISFGTDTDLFYPSDTARNRFREINNIKPDDFVVIYTGKLTKAKDGLLLATAFKNKFDKPITLVCVGTPGTDDYGQQVKKLFDESENRIIMFPIQNYLDLAPFYQMADLSVFPRQCSMSFYDAQACGIPVLSEDNNINVDRCSHKNGLNFKAGDVEDFRAKIMMFASMSEEELQTLRHNSRAFIESGYDYKDIASQYTDYLKKAVKRFKTA